MLIFLWEFTISVPSKRVLEKLRRLANKVNYFKYSLARTIEIKNCGISYSTASQAATTPQIFCPQFSYSAKTWQEKKGHLPITLAVSKDTPD